MYVALYIEGYTQLYAWMGCTNTNAFYAFVLRDPAREFEKNKK